VNQKDGNSCTVYDLECGTIVFIMAVTGESFGCLFVNYLTFPGVILHELSHALMAMVTGAKVTHIRFFAVGYGGIF
jgi:hypothetical protein